MFRRDPGVDADSLHPAYELLVGHFLEFLSGEGPVSFAEDPHLPRHGHRGELVVPRDHDDPDARLLASTDRLDRIGPRRVHHPRQPEEGEIRLEDFFLERRQVALEFANRKTEHAQGSCGQLLVPEQVLLPIVFGEGLPFPIHDVMGTSRENPLRRALHMKVRGSALEASEPLPLGQREDLANLRGGQGRVQARHLLPLGCEGDLREPRPFRPNGLRVHPRPSRGNEERPLGRIALDDPASTFSLEHRVVAEDPTFEEPLQSRMGPEIRAFAVGPDDARRIESLSDDLIFPGGRNHRADVHFPFREGPGLVRADHGGGAQGLDRGKFPNQGPAPDHSLEAQCEADRHDRGESLRDRRDRQPDRRQEQEFDVARVPDDADREDDPRRKQDRDTDLPSEAVQLPLERRLLFRLLLDESGNLPELGRHAGLDDDGLAAPSVDRGPHEHHVLAVAQERVAGQRLDRLADGERFAGQRRLVDAEACDLEEPSVRGDSVARREDGDVAGHQLAGRHGDDPTFSEDMGLRRGQALECLEGPFRPVLLHEAEDRVHDHDDDDEHGVIQVLILALQHPQSRGDDRRDDQDNHEDVHELTQQDPQRTHPRGLNQLVRPEAGQPLRGLPARQAQGRRIQLLEDGLRPKGVPVVRHRASNMRIHNKARPGHPSEWNRRRKRAGMHTCATISSTRHGPAGAFTKTNRTEGELSRGDRTG